MSLLKGFNRYPPSPFSHYITPHSFHCDQKHGEIVDRGKVIMSVCVQERHKTFFRIKGQTIALAYLRMMAWQIKKNRNTSSDFTDLREVVCFRMSVTRNSTIGVTSQVQGLCFNFVGVYIWFRLFVNQILSQMQTDFIENIRTSSDLHLPSFSLMY